MTTDSEDRIKKLYCTESTFPAKQDPGSAAPVERPLRSRGPLSVLVTVTPNKDTFA